MYTSHSSFSLIRHSIVDDLDAALEQFRLIDNDLGEEKFAKEI